MPHQLTFTVTVDDPSIERVVRQLQATITRAIAAVNRCEKTTEPVPSMAKSEDQLLWGVGQVAKALDISQRHVARLSESGAMPKPLHLGSLVRWNADELREWISTGCQRP